MVKVVVNYVNVIFICVVGSELVRKFIGEGVRLVYEFFEFVKEKVFMIIFIDEIDVIGVKRMDEIIGGEREVNRIFM